MNLRQNLSAYLIKEQKNNSINSANKTSSSGINLESSHNETVVQEAYRRGIEEATQDCEKKWIIKEIEIREQCRNEQDTVRISILKDLGERLERLICAEVTIAIRQIEEDIAAIQRQLLTSLALKRSLGEIKKIMDRIGDDLTSHSWKIYVPDKYLVDLAELTNFTKQPAIDIISYNGDEITIEGPATTISTALVAWADICLQTGANNEQ